jgi:hypothetical protein
MMNDLQQTPLLFFHTGGMRFAVNAESIETIGGRNWEIKDDHGPSPEDLEVHKIHVAPILELPTGEESRAIVVRDGNNVFAFFVEHITKDKMTNRSVSPVPPLLKSWLNPDVISGFLISENQSITSILDLLQLAKSVSKQKNN